jgi:hypothetical protein
VTETHHKRVKTRHKLTKTRQGAFIDTFPASCILWQPPSLFPIRVHPCSSVVHPLGTDFLGEVHIFPLAFLAKVFYIGSGRLAQLVEQLTLNQRVAGSSPAASTPSFLAFRTISPVLTRVIDITACHRR